MRVKKIFHILIFSTYFISIFCYEPENIKAHQSKLSLTLTTSFKSCSFALEKIFEERITTATQTGSLNFAEILKDEESPEDILEEVLKVVANLNIKIEIFSLEGNNLKYIPEILFTFKSLKFLFLSRNKLTHIPLEINHLTNLEYLEVNQNKLISLQLNIGVLTKLKKLFLKENEILNLPKSITDLENLEELDLSNNQIVKIPKSIDKLKKLEILNLQNNSLKKLPDSLTNLKCLYWLSVYNNPLKLKTKSMLFQLQKERRKMQIIF